MRKLVWAGKVEFTTHLLRYGLVVRISGSHPGGPGSIPGNGILFHKYFSVLYFKYWAYLEEQKFPTPGVEPGPPA